MWAGMAGAQHSVWSSPSRTVWVFVGCAAALLGLGLLWWRTSGWSTHTLFVVAGGLILGLVVGVLFWNSLQARTDALTHSRSGKFLCDVVGDPVKGMYGYSVAARVRSNEGRGALVTVLLPDSGTPGEGSSGEASSGNAALPGCGQALEVRGRASAPAREGEWGLIAHRRGQAASIKAWKTTILGDSRGLAGFVAPYRRKLLAATSRCKGNGGSLLQGVLLGERSRIRGTRLEDEFRTTGLSHLLAVSGTHISIVSMLAGSALAAMGTPLRRRLLLAVIFAGGYVLLTGAPTSSLRAFVMTLAAAFASLGGRRGDSLGGLSAAVVGLLAISPPNAFDIGFALSVCAVGGLVVFAPLADEWARAASTGRMKKLASALAVPVVAQCATLPVAIPAFNMISIVGPVANALVLPAASLGLCVGVASAVLMAVWPRAGMGLMRVAALVFQGVCQVVDRLARLPRAAVAVGGSALQWGVVAFAIGALLWVFWPHPERRRTARWVVAIFLVYVVFVAVGFQGRGGARLVVLDVGQGDAILVADGDRAVLIDTGPDESVMRTAAGRAGIRRLDAVLLTHPHADHDGGLGGLADVVSVGRIGLPALTAQEFDGMPGEASAMTGQPPLLFAQGDRMKVGGWELTVLWPPNDGSEWDTNDTSLVIEASYGSFRAILTGDAETDPQIAMGRSGLLRDCNVLKIAHHGSAAGTSDGALRTWDPELALISVGVDNDFGHPTHESLSLLEAAGVRVERTDDSGDLTISVSDTAYKLMRQ